MGKQRLKNRFWQPKLERMSRKEIVRLQVRRLRRTVDYVYRRSRFYRARLKGANLHPNSIKSLDDLKRIPLTTKADLRDGYPFGLLAVPLDEVVRIHASSGTTGDPTVVAYTKKDLNSWAECLARSLTMTGVAKGDIFQVVLGYGLFTGGLGFHYGAERIGAAVIPSATGNTKRQVKLMKDFGVTAFTSIPSYSLFLAEVAQQQGIDPSRDLKIRTVSCGAEAWSEGTRRKLESIFGCYVFNSYGLSEVCGPGVAFECIRQNGLHVWSDQFIAETIDPRTGENLGPEEKGEIVLTTLTREAMPLLRYRTRDIASILDENVCECGRSHTKISWISGRTDDMLKIRGVNIFPSQVEAVLMGLPRVGNNYQLIVSRKGYLDELKVRIEVTKAIFSGELKDLVSMRDQLESELESVLGIRILVELVEPGSIPRIEGKAQRMLDERRVK